MLSQIGEIVAAIVYNWVFPLWFTIVFVVFIWGTFTYLVTGATDEEMKEKGKALLFYAFLSFLAMVLVWTGANFIRALIPG